MLHTPIVAEMISFGASTYPSRADRWPTHLHSFHQFDLTLGGEVFLRVEGGRPIRSVAGDAVVIPALIRHGHQTKSGMRIAMAKFRVHPQFESILGRRPFRIRMTDWFIKGLEAAAGAMKDKAPLASQQSVAALTGCLVEAVRRSGSKDSGALASDAFRQRLWQMVARIEEDPFADWTVAGMAAEFHLTPDHFSKRCREALRQTPQDYLVQARMRAAALRLASDPDLSIKELAASAGYATVHGFTRVFSRKIGISPAAYRSSSTEM